MKIFGAQHQVFNGILPYYSRARPPVGKFIDPDSDILRVVKDASPSTTTIVRIYTGSPTVDDAAQHPNAEQYGRDYADLVYSRVQDPAHMDFLESENEPNDHYANLTEFIKRLNAFLVGFSARAKQLGFRPLGPNFSVGYPEVYVQGTDYELWPNAWQGLTEGLRALRDANGALSLHEYDYPDLFRLWSDARQLGYLVGRHKAVYRSLPADLQSLPLYITEFETDWILAGTTGGFWHGREGDAAEAAPAWMVSQMRECWTRIYSTTPQLRGVAFFLWGRNDPTWKEYDIALTEASVNTFTQFFSEELAGTSPPNPIPPEPPMPIAITPAETIATVPFLVKRAIQLDLGPSIYGEYSAKSADGTLYHAWIWQRGGVCVKDGDYGALTNAFLFNPQTGEKMAQPLPWPGGGNAPPPGIPPYSFPTALSDSGACGEEGFPIAGKPFYRVTSGAVLQGVSAFATVFLKGVGAQVVNLFPDGRGEVFTLINDGNVTFNFGAASAFSSPCTGPFTIFVAEGAVKNPDTKMVTWKNILSDKVESVGDWQAEHSEWRIQFAQAQ